MVSEICLGHFNIFKIILVKITATVNYEFCVISDSYMYLQLSLLHKGEIKNLVNSLYVHNINPLADVYLANIFSHSVGCLFTLLIISFVA
jgi:hypothetical protein